MRDPSEIWTGFASSYDWARPMPPSALLDLLTQLIGMPHPALVVDVGSGTGLSTAIWGERAEQVIGIEPNADMRTRPLSMNRPGNNASVVSRSVHTQGP